MSRPTKSGSSPTDPRLPAACGRREISPFPANKEAVLLYGIRAAKLIAGMVTVLFVGAVVTAMLFSGGQL